MKSSSKKRDSRKKKKKPNLGAPISTLHLDGETRGPMW